MADLGDSQDAETVAEGLKQESGGRIKTGVYHSKVEEEAKENLHRKWREGDIKVVCATIGGYSLMFKGFAVDELFRCSVWSRY